MPEQHLSPDEFADMTEIDPSFLREEDELAERFFVPTQTEEEQAVQKRVVRIIDDKAALIRLAHKMRINKQDEQSVIGDYVRGIVDKILKNRRPDESGNVILDLGHPRNERAYKRKTREIYCLGHVKADTERDHDAEEMPQLSYDEYLELADHFRKRILILLRDELMKNGIDMEAGIMGGYHGEGGMYEVHSCRIGNTDMAIKIPKQTVREPRWRIGRNYDQKLINALVETTENCENTVRLYGSTLLDLGDEGQYRLDYLEELEEGTDLIGYFNRLNLNAENIEGNPIFVEFLESILIPALNGVRGFHRKGLVHRDLKPENIIIFNKDQKSMVKVADIDLARFSGYISEDISGTPAYISPEVCNGRECTDKSDIYAIGKMLYILLGGEVSNNIWGEVTKSIKGINLSGFNLDPKFKDIIEKCLDLNPKNRPDIDELIRIIEDYIGDAKESNAIDYSSSVTLPPLPISEVIHNAPTVQNSLSSFPTIPWHIKEEDFLPFADTEVRTFKEIEQQL